MKCAHCGVILKEPSILRSAATIVRRRTPRKSFLTEVIARTLENIAAHLEKP